MGQDPASEHDAIRQYDPRRSGSLRSRRPRNTSPLQMPANCATDHSWITHQIGCANPAGAHMTNQGITCIVGGSMTAVLPGLADRPQLARDHRPDWSFGEDP